MIILIYRSSDIMPSRSISITEDVYKQLDNFRIKNESFSQAIRRLLESNLDLMELAGAWKKIPDVKPALDLLEDTVKKIHDTENKDIELI